MHAMIIDQQCFRLQNDLLTFLQQLCQRDTRTLLWCVAICIDQEGLSERNHKVRLMGKIYEHAATVLVWLPYLIVDPLLHSGNLDLSLMSINGISKEELWVLFADLCTDPYWTRTWIIQELLLARQVMIMYGTHSIEWDMFDEIFEISQADPISDSQSSASIANTAIRNARIFAIEFSPSSVLHVMGI